MTVPGVFNLVLVNKDSNGLWKMLRLSRLFLHQKISAPSLS